jgi:hypothetical protein
MQAVERALLRISRNAIILMGYEPLFERFEAAGPDGHRLHVQFLRAGFLTAGDRPELYFYRVEGPNGQGEEVVVGISGRALRCFENERRFLSREEKIDLAGLLLKQKIEAGKALDSQNLFARDEELAQLAGELGIPA